MTRLVVGETCLENLRVCVAPRSVRGQAIPATLVGPTDATRLLIHYLMEI
jgi:hypothetical protein